MNEDGFECYKESLFFHGVPIHDYEDNELKMWYTLYMDNMEMDVSVHSYNFAIEDVSRRDHTYLKAGRNLR